MVLCSAILTTWWGSNIVNVIFVDFRGFDTFGEITVLGIAAIGALCLMDGMRTWYHHDTRPHLPL
jgi:multisubunit Na+/H+ antiporter MnhB subunit